MQDLKVLSPEDVRGLAEQVTRVEWDWSTESVGALADALGWTVTDPGDDVLIRADTGLGVGNNVADFQASGGRIKWISIRVTDRADDPAAAAPLLQDTFVGAAKALEEKLGRPTERAPGRRPSMTWRRAGYAISLHSLSRGVILRVTSGEYLETVEEATRVGL